MPEQVDCYGRTREPVRTRDGSVAPLAGVNRLRQLRDAGRPTAGTVERPSRSVMPTMFISLSVEVIGAAVFCFAVQFIFEFCPRLDRQALIQRN